MMNYAILYHKAWYQINKVAYILHNVDVSNPNQSTVDSAIIAVVYKRPTM